MNTNFVVAAAVSALLITGCPEKAPDSTKAPKPAPAPAPAPSSPVAVQPFKNLEIAAGPNSPHTTGSYDPVTGTISADKSQAGAVIFGPYTPLPSGKYRATYFVTAESDINGAELGRVDVNAVVPGKSGVIVQQLPLKSARGEQSIPLAFEATDPGKFYEFRVWADGKGGRVTFKKILVERL